MPWRETIDPADFIIPYPSGWRGWLARACRRLALHLCGLPDIGHGFVDVTGFANTMNTELAEAHARTRTRIREIDASHEWLGENALAADRRLVLIDDLLAHLVDEWDFHGDKGMRNRLLAAASILHRTETEFVRPLARAWDTVGSRFPWKETATPAPAPSEV